MPDPEMPKYGDKRLKWGMQGLRYGTPLPASITDPNPQPGGDMNVKLKFNFDPDLLTTKGPQIVAGATSIPGVVARLPENYLADTTTLIESIPGLASAQKLQTGTTGTLTTEQNVALDLVNEWITKARATAKKAFPGQDVKLRAEFQVGINKPVDLPSVKARGLIVQKSCAEADNFAALRRKGWMAQDTTDFAAALAALGTTDDTQEASKIDRGGDTGALHTAQNEVYAKLLTIQNAGNLELPASNPANAVLRASLLLGVFPPKEKGKQPPAPSPTPPPPQP